MNAFKILLEKFDAILREYNPVNYEKLQEPLSRAEIERYLNCAKIEDEDFRLLLTWKNGFDFSHATCLDSRIFKSGALLSLEDITGMTKASKEIWASSFIPLITDGSGDFILFNNNKDAGYGKLHLYSVGLLFIEDPISCYDSIYSMVETTIAAYEQGIILYNEADDWLETDIGAYWDMAKKYNKSSEYWKLE
jgi:hypothetical protein